MSAAVDGHDRHRAAGRTGTTRRSRAPAHECARHAAARCAGGGCRRRAGRRNATASMRSSASSVPPLTSDRRAARRAARSGCRRCHPRLERGAPPRRARCAAGRVRRRSRRRRAATSTRDRACRCRAAAARSAHGLQEQLAVVQRDPRDACRCRIAGNTIVCPGPPTLTGKSDAASGTLAERIAQDQFGRDQMGSSQRIDERRRRRLRAAG